MWIRVRAISLYWNGSRFMHNDHTEEECPVSQWEHRILRRLMALTWPSVLSSLSFNGVALINTLLVSHAGTAELAGAGFGSAVGFMLLSFAYGVLRGAKTLVSQSVGAKQHEKVEWYQGAALTFAVVAGVIVLGLAELAALLVPLLTASADAGHATQLYLAVGMLAAPVMIWNTSLRECSLGEGDSRTPMYATIFSNAVNVAAGFLFIFVLKWGIIGAALSSICAHSADCLVLTWRQGRKHRLRLFNWSYLREVWKLGLPCGLQFCLEVGAFTLLAMLIAGFGKEQMAAHQIALNVVQFCLMPITALAESAAVLTGQAMGAGKRGLVMRVAHLTVICAMVYASICAAGLFSAPGRAVSLFTGDGALISAACGLLLLAACFMVFDAANIVARSCLRSVGDLKVPALVGVTCAWILTPPLTWLLGYHFGMGITGGWIGICGNTLLGSIILWYRLQCGRWRSPLDEPQPAVAPAG